jgi:hypothetical protein
MLSFVPGPHRQRLEIRDPRRITRCAAPGDEIRQSSFGSTVRKDETCGETKEMPHQFLSDTAIPPPVPILHGTGSGGGTSGFRRTKSVFSMSSVQSSVSDSSETSSSPLHLQPPTQIQEADRFQIQNVPHSFGRDVRAYTEDSPWAPVFDAGMRKVLEPHLRRARLDREHARQLTVHCLGQPVESSIGSSAHVPYTSLRYERRFLFDEQMYPLHLILAQTLNVQDLSQVHQVVNADLMKPLLCRDTRRAFHVAYDNFITSFCLPLLHEIAMIKNIVHSASHRVTYRYQAFPNISIVRPGDEATLPTCQTAQGKSIGCLYFHIPLTPSHGTNALYAESYPGKEDWHPLQAKSFGLGYLFDGARCLQFGLENTTKSSRVSLDFSVALYCESSVAKPNHCRHQNRAEDRHTVLCPPELLHDAYSRGGPGYYEEAVIDLSRPTATSSARHNAGTKRCTSMVQRKRGCRLMEPDGRMGAPFV